MRLGRQSDSRGYEILVHDGETGRLLRSLRLHTEVPAPAARLCVCACVYMLVCVPVCVCDSDHG